jgi:FkbM family methyltransferase
VRKNHLTLSNHLSLLLSRLRINCVIDVGANRGQYGAELRRIGYAGRIVSFEPVMQSFERLDDASRRDPNWIAFNYALGEARGSLEIYVTRESALSSVYPLNEYAARRFQKERAEVLRTEKAKLARLDDFLDEAVSGIDRPRVFLKMDTQGYDLRVIEGATRSLRRTVGLQSELSVIPISDGMPDYLTALRRYRELGFEVTGFYPVMRDRDSLVLVEFDCVMQRKDASTFTD